jgi:hypothetical protein
MKQLKQLLYVSRTGLTLSQWELNGILSVSRWNNTRAEITGLLMHMDGGFLQFLEGQPNLVDRAFARIRVDTRHWEMRLLLERQSEPQSERQGERLFPDWPMGFVQPHPAAPETEGLHRIGQQVIVDRLSPGSVPTLVQMLRAYYHIQSEAGLKLAA